MTKKSSMATTTDHSLSSLVGKKIKGISMKEIDIHGDGQNVRQFYTINCTDGEKFVLAVDGNCTAQYATAELIEYDDFADFLEELECEQFPEEEDSLSESDEESDDEENMFDNDDKLFDDQDDDNDY